MSIDSFETKMDETITKVWKWNQIIPTIILIIIIALIPFPEFIRPILFLLALWLGSYLIRERWRLILTDHQIIARQLFPRPFTFLTKDHHFPLKQIEGLSVGPRAFHSILLVGLFLTTNVGVTLLKNGLLTRGVDLPDYLDALILVLKGMTFIPGMEGLANRLEEGSNTTVSFIQKEVQIFLGIVFIAIGVIIVLATIPRFDHMQIRVRHGKDFKLEGGVNKSFWKNCYKELYHIPFTDIPKEFKDWDFPWLEGEKVEGMADLIRTIYFNRVVGILAFYVAIIRIYVRATGPEPFFSSTVIYWLLVAIVDLFIIIVGIKFSTEKNQMVVTNQRIILSHEVPKISGSFGRRLFYMSDIRRDDVASFHFKKLKRFSLGYLSSAITAILIFYFLYDRMGYITRVIFVALIAGLFFFVNQTYVEFQVRTKGGDRWSMRHQLSNPATGLRKMIGFQNPLVNTIMTNRLEESEIAEVIQLVRSRDFNLKPSLDNINDDFQLSVKELLLPDEEINITQNISRKIPKRRRVLILATLIFMLWLLSIGGSYTIVTEQSHLNETVAGSIMFLAMLGGMYLLIMLWIKYYSLFRSTLIITNHRIFLQHRKNPPKILFYFGVLSELHVTEAVLSEVSSIYSSRDLKQLDYWRSGMGYLWRFIISTIMFGIILSILVSLSDNVDTSSGLLNQDTLHMITPIFFGLSVYFSLNMAWCASNSFVELVRGWPKRLLNVNGIGFQFSLPFLNSTNASNIKESIWKLHFGGKNIES